MKTKLLRGELFKRVLSLALTLVMLLSFAPNVPHASAAEGTTVYLVPNSNWLIDNARFAVYYWNGSTTNWVSMTAVGDGYYEAVVPSGYSNIIFCRMNPSTTANNWNNKWNQTSDLTIPTNGNNCYTVKVGTWDNGGGTWSYYHVAATYSVGYTLTNVKSSNTETSIEENTAYTTTLSAEDGYALPGSVSVTVGGTAISTHSYDSTTGVLTIPTASVTGDIVITASGVKLTYLKPNSEWLSDGARFAAYYWNDSGNHWVDMTDADGDGYYEAVIPEGYTNIIFCRMSSSATANNWNNKWNQTGDLTIPTDGKNCYTVPSGEWDNSGNAYWSVYPEKDEDDSGDDGDDTGDTGAAYYVAGDKALCGVEWSNNATANKMTYVSGGVYEKVYSSVAAGTYNLKVTDGTWDNCWGDNGNNYTFVVSKACDVTVSFNSNTKTVTVSGDYVGKETGLDVSAMYAVGNGSGAWLNGVSWDPTASANAMTQTSANVYEITFNNVPAGTAYEFKFAANGAWTHSWGGGGSDGEAVYNGQNIKLTVPYDTANVTLKLDMTGYSHSTKTGAKYSVTITEVTGPEYYLIGYINGADYGNADDWQNLGEYKFVNGKLTATFTENSYVGVKTGDNASWYWAESYCTDTSVTLKTGAGEKLYVPGNVELTFTLVENSDGTLTLSYATPEVEIPEGYTAVRIHFLRPDSWGSSINAYTWNGFDNGSWPGSAISQNSQKSGWYDLIVPQETPTSFNFIFNDGGNQTNDLTTGTVTGDTELWVVGDTVYTEAPGEWSGVYTYNVTIHALHPDGWADSLNAYVWDKNDTSLLGTWPGTAMAADAINDGWYTASLSVVDDNSPLNVIISDGNGNQTIDLSTGTLVVNTQIWIVDGAVLTAAPAGWVDPNRTVHVPGTFPGPSWDSASNQMTYDPELGLYVYTFKDVPAANYEYKIAINGSWSENYGVGGAPDGANIAVAVPETMDVTIWYNDETHNSVNSVTYVFADITLSGTNIPEGTKLTDKGLTGIYSVTVPMTAGTYEDLKLTLDGVDYPFKSFELKNDKDVTFYFDPASGLYYHNGSDIKVSGDYVYFNSKDLAYKDPFGAVAQGEEVAFNIVTGDDVTQAILVVPGYKTFEMQQPEVMACEAGTKTWTCTATFNIIGEYDYYFALTNGSDMKVYCDDDGYYGEGHLTELANVMPYDLVVYKAGYETPDWMKNAVIYQIFPDRFFDGDSSNNLAQTWARGEVDYEYISDWYALPENPEQEEMLSESVYKSTGAWYGDGEWSNEIYGGDLQGILQRIDYLKALGVNVIYLNPVFWSISNHRYDAVDYTQIDPILGTLGDFEQLVAVAEANGMHIILDGVFNHVSDDSIYFDRYYKFLTADDFDGKIGAYPYWAYVYDYMSENSATKEAAEAAAKAYFSETYSVTDYSYTEWFAVSSTTMTGTVDNIGLRAGKEVYSYEGWWGYDSMPVIYSTNGSEYQTGNWAQEIISGSGSVTQYWISKGSNGWRLDVANEVSDETWQRFRESVKGLDSDAVIIGEIWDDATKYLKGDMYDSVMNYLFRNAVTSFAMGASSEQTTKDLEKIRERYPEEAFYAMMNLVGSHDTTRLLSYLDGIGDDRSDKSLSAAFPTYASTSSAAKNRQYLVAFLQFTYPGAPTIYYGDEIGMVGADDPDDRRAMDWGNGNQEIVEWYAKMAAIREAYPALRTGAIEPLDLDSSNLLAYVRSDDSNTLIVIGNNASSTKTVTLPAEYAGSYVDLVSGNAWDGTVAGLRGVVLVPADQAKTITVNYSGLAPAYDDSYIVSARDVTHTHSYTKGETVAPTCTEEGYTLYSCTCGDSYKDDKVPATGHSYGEPTWKWASDYSSATATFKCACGDTVTVTDKDISSITTAATCTAAGKTVYTASVKLGDKTYTVKAEKTINKLNHTDANKDNICDVCKADVSNSTTGDMMFLWIIVLAAASGAIVLLYVNKRRLV